MSLDFLTSRSATLSMFFMTFLKNLISFGFTSASSMKMPMIFCTTTELTRVGFMDATLRYSAFLSRTSSSHIFLPSSITGLLKQSTSHSSDARLQSTLANAPLELPFPAEALSLASSSASSATTLAAVFSETPSAARATNGRPLNFHGLWVRKANCPEPVRHGRRLQELTVLHKSPSTTDLHKGLSASGKAAPLGSVVGGRVEVTGSGQALVEEAGS
mmetsp:Transcript_22127/g.50640  ORF Transcript_22127/g.50640 Transcript_22127/m.50640 type:complete len:217 (+) Transcript_22127:704-1354(+)